MGCRGGWPYYAWYYTQYFGLEDEKDYPYRGFMSKCKHRPRNALVATKRGEPYFEAGNVPWALKLAISKGPQAAAIQGYTRLFQSYRSGVITSPACGQRVDHAVLIIGYGSENGLDYFIIKNSWGTDWGEDGYGRVRIAPGKGICGVNHFVSWPNIVNLLED